MDRDEYAAAIRQAFDAETVRSISGGSTFSDVPDGYWADAAIEEAYETGFLGTPDPNEFEPQTEISRADAIVALVEGLGLSSNVPTASVPTAAVPAAAEPVQPVRQKRRQPPNRLMFPMASTAMMQLFAPPAQAAAPNPPSAQANGTNPEADAEVGLDLSQYYADAEQIPDYARDEVAIATQAGLIVNYPELSLLNPNAPISRGGTAALIHRALVYQNEMALVDSADAKAYIVQP